MDVLHDGHGLGQCQTCQGENSLSAVTHRTEVTVDLESRHLLHWIDGFIRLAVLLAAVATKDT